PQVRAPIRIPKLRLFIVILPAAAARPVARTASKIAAESDNAAKVGGSPARSGRACGVISRTCERAGNAPEESATLPRACWMRALVNKPRHPHLRLTALALLLFLCATAAADEKRIALVIGNSTYSMGSLPNPANDAKLVGETLGSLGFEI